MSLRHRPVHVRGGRLFSEPAQREDPAAHIAYVDGASRGNPGPASYAVILRGPDGKLEFQLGKYLGRATNNVAEYFALITALDYAAEHGIRRLRVRSDSELLVRQMQGAYKVKSAALRPLYERARKALAGFDSFAIQHVPREQNAEADALANAALDRTSSRLIGTPQEENKKEKTENRRIRAKWSRGALVPAEPLDLAEGEEVEIAIRKPRE